MATGPEIDKPLALKIPAWQTATLLLLAAVSAFLAIYLPVGLEVRVLAILVAVGLAGGGIIAARAYLVADDDGIGVRGMFRERSVDWRDFADVVVVKHTGSITLRVLRTDNSGFDVPPSLVLPLRPEKSPTARARLERLALELRQRLPRP
ncbi:MAG: PH domain-containing protein [Jatrophihabitans sp.]